MAIQRTSRIPEFNRALPNVLRENVEDAINMGRNGILQRLSGTRSGKIYRVPGTRREYRASAPGESPASRLGDLRKSIRTQMLPDGSGIVYTSNPIAPMLEKGTSRMRPRPFFQVGLIDRLPDIRKALGRRVDIRWV